MIDFAKTMKKRLNRQNLTVNLLQEGPSLVRFRIENVGPEIEPIEVR